MVVQWSLKLVENNNNQFINSIKGGTVSSSHVNELANTNIWTIDNEEIEIWFKDETVENNNKMYEIFAGLINMSSYITNQCKIFCFNFTSLLSDDQNIISNDSNLASLIDSRLKYTDMILLPAKDHLYLLIMYEKKNIIFVIGVESENEEGKNEKEIREINAKNQIKMLLKLSPYRSEFDIETNWHFDHNVKVNVANKKDSDNMNWIVLLMMYSIGYHVMKEAFSHKLYFAVKDKPPSKTNKKSSKKDSLLNLYPDAVIYLKSVFEWMKSITEKKGKQIITLLVFNGEYQEINNETE